MRKILYVVFLFFLLVIQTRGQNIYDGLVKEIAVGVNFGEIYFYGDISEPNGFQPAFSLNMEKSLDKMGKLQLEFITGRMSGRNYFSTMCDNPHHIDDGGLQVIHQRKGEVFNAEFMEFDVNYLLDLSVFFRKIVDNLDVMHINIDSSKEDRKLMFLAKFGLGINIFRTVRKELQNEVFINSYGYEWIWDNNFQQAGVNPDPWNKSIRESTVLYGFLTKYRFSKRIDIVFSVVNRVGDHDKWDAKLNQKSDVYTFYSLGPTFNF